MGFLFALPMLLGWLGSGTVSLPSICTNPDYECIRATQLPQRFTAGGFSSPIPDPPWPSTPPVNYFPFASEDEAIALRTVQGTDTTRRSIFPKDAPYCYFHFDAPDPWASPQLIAGGFLPTSSHRQWHYTWAWTPVSTPPPILPPCWQINHDSLEVGYMAPIVCPVGWSILRDDPAVGYACYRLKKAPCDKICTKAGNPIDVFLKNKIQREEDYSGPGLLQVNRLYRSDGFSVPVGALTPTRSFGLVWRHYYDRQLVEVQGTNGLMVELNRADGQTWNFLESATGYQGNADSPGQLTRLYDAQNNPTGWHYESPSDEIEIYDALGVLQRIERRDGNYVILTYDADRRLLAVTDEHGRTLRFAYDAFARIASIVLPDAALIRYDYTAAQTITAVYYPDGSTRKYQYEDTVPHGGSPQLSMKMDKPSPPLATTKMDIPYPAHMPAVQMPYR